MRPSCLRRVAVDGPNDELAFVCACRRRPCVCVCMQRKVYIDVDGIANVRYIERICEFSKCGQTYWRHNAD